jgi:hypothetical protein
MKKRRKKKQRCKTQNAKISKSQNLNQSRDMEKVTMAGAFREYGRYTKAWGALLKT